MALKDAYKKIVEDHFPESIRIQMGDLGTLAYQKRVWTIEDPATKQSVTKGLRYGENPGQEAALYELVNGNLLIGECQYIQPVSG